MIENPKNKTELGAAIKERHDAVSAIFNKADAEQDGVCTKEQQAEIVRLNHQAEEFEQSYKSLDEQDALKAANQRRADWLNGSRGNMPPLPGGANPREQAARKSIADMFLGHDGIKAWLNEVAPNGREPAKGHSPGGLRSPIVDLSANLAIKDLLTGASATSAGSLVYADHQGLLDPGTFRRPLYIRDLVSQGQTGSDRVDFVRIDSATNNAAPTAEATATSGGSGTKPESAMTSVLVTENVKSVPTWIPATRRALADVPQLRTIIESILMYFVAEELDDQMISGDGTGENFTGVLHVSGTGSQSYSNSILETTRKARTKVIIQGRAVPSAYVMHPNDWETFDLTTDQEGRYYFGGPVNEGSPRLWGVPVVETEAVPQGTAIVADWRWATLWDRQQSSLLISDSHSDFFIRNLIALLVELRAAFGIVRPAAFILADLTP